MFILRDLLSPFQALFLTSEEGLQRRTWFVCTLLAIIVPFTPSRTSNLLRSLRTLVGLSVDESCYYHLHGFTETALASPVGHAVGLDPRAVDREGRLMVWPLRQTLGERVQVLTRLRVSNTLYALPPDAQRRAGRPRKYGAKLGSASELAAVNQARAKPYAVSLYGKSSLTISS